MLAVIQNIPVLIYCTRIVHSYVSVIKWYYIIIFKEYINMHSWYSCLYRSISGILPTVCDSDSDCPIHHLKTWGKLSHKTLRRLFSQDLGKKKHQKPLETRVRWDGTYDHTCILMYSWVLWLESLIATYVYICILFIHIYLYIYTIYHIYFFCIWFVCSTGWSFRDFFCRGPSLLGQLPLGPACAPSFKLDRPWGCLDRCFWQLNVVVPSYLCVVQELRNEILTV